MTDVIDNAALTWAPDIPPSDLEEFGVAAAGGNRAADRDDVGTVQAYRAAARGQAAAFRLLHQDHRDEQGRDDRVNDEQESEQHSLKSMSNRAAKRAT